MPVMSFRVSLIYTTAERERLEPYLEIGLPLVVTEEGERGIADGISRVRDTNVLSTISAVICVVVTSRYVAWHSLLLTAWELR